MTQASTTRTTLSALQIAILSVASGLLFSTASGVFAQAAPVKPAAQSPAKAPAKPAAKAPVKAAAGAAAGAGAGAAVAASSAPKALSPEMAMLVERVETGRFPCELGNAVTVTQDSKNPEFFDVSGGGSKFRMTPVATTTGAIRLEDKKSGGVWLGLANKSMLLNEKMGKRLADECQSPKQKAVAEQLKAAPAANPLESK
jgi:hypothetical protein